VKFNQDLSRVRNAALHRCFIYVLAKFILFVTTITTCIFLNITNIFQLNDNNLAASQAAETTKCDKCVTEMSREQCCDVKNNMNRCENKQIFTIIVSI